MSMKLVFVAMLSATTFIPTNILYGLSVSALQYNIPIGVQNFICAVRGDFSTHCCFCYLLFKIFVSIIEKCYVSVLHTIFSNMTMCTLSSFS